MLRYLLPAVLALASQFVVMALPASAQPGAARVNQYSALTQADQPLFAARLGLPGKPDSRSLLSSPPASEMEYRIVSERLSSRRFFKMLSDAVAVNTDAAALAKNAGYLSRTRAALTSELQPGDSLVYRFDGARSTQLLHNGVLLLTVDSPDFYPMLLATWVGQVPISSRFKREILGQSQPDAQVQAWYQNAQPAAGRSAAIASQLRARQPAATATLAAASPAAKPASSSAPAAKAEARAQPQPQPKEKPQAQAKPQAKPQAQPKAKPQAKPEPQPSTELAAAPVQPIASATAPVESAHSGPEPQATVALAGQPEQGAVELTEAEEARLLLIRQEYLKQLGRDINVHKHLPRQAFSRRAEGSVRLALSLDSNGKLLKAEVVEPSRYAMFNDQALEAVQQAQPFAPPPAALESDPFEFEITLYYDLPL